MQFNFQQQFSELLVIILAGKLVSGSLCILYDPLRYYGNRSSVPGERGRSASRCCCIKESGWQDVAVTEWE